MNDTDESRESAAAPPPLDVVEVLAEEHAELRRLFDEVQAASPQLAGARLRSLRTELMRHEGAEELIVFPYLRPLVHDDSELERRIDEQARMEEILAAIERTRAGGNEFRQRMNELRATFLRHVAAEEAHVFPQLEHCTAAERVALADRLLAAQRQASSHPHPHAPDTPPANRVVAPLLAIVDKLRDAAGGA